MNWPLGSFYQYKFADLQKLFAEAGLPKSTGTLLYNWHYKKSQQRPCELFGYSKLARSFVSTNFDFALPKIKDVRTSSDKTAKFKLSLHDGMSVESVLIPFQNKYTLCLSSQVGCAMSCTFCYTGTQGFSRHLSAAEIVGQFLVVLNWLKTHRPTDSRILNIVYMGQGEPLHNFDAVKRSAMIFISQHGLSLAGHKITISTSGYRPGLERWLRDISIDMPDVNIALSLHSPYEEKRSQLIPINKRYPLAQILPLVDGIPRGKKRFVTYEYLLAKDFNDSSEDAHATGRLLQGKKAYINLIPFNPFPGARFARPEEVRIANFKKILGAYNIPTLVRTTKGDKILAACGQLNTVERPLNLSDSSKGHLGALNP